MQAIDFHTHAFPDELAAKALAKLSEAGDVEPKLDGTISDLLRSMDRAGIEKSVVACIATRPGQFDSIVKWARAASGDRIVVFPSVHPMSPDAAENVRQVTEEGFKGIKLHPYYQEFLLDDERVFPVYEEMQRHGLVLLSHTGFDFAFPRERVADPRKVIRVKERFPALTLVTSHLGGWNDWDEVQKHLVGSNVYMETSFSLELMPREQARSVITSHRPDRVMFGTDSPWTDQEQALGLLRGLDLDPELEAAIMRQNALRLLGEE